MTETGYAANAALFFVLPALYTAGFQFAMAGGAPWGHLTLGGRWPGRLPPPIRLLALLQGVIALLMIAVVLDRGGVLAFNWPDWTYYATLVMLALSVVANAATPSKPERRIGLPVAGVMVLSAGLASLL